MEEYLFRGQDSKNKWVYGSFVHQKPAKYLAEEFFIFVPNETGVHSVGVKPGTIGQYSGLKDSEGKKGFKGDIVSILDYDSQTIFNAWEVGMIDGSWQAQYLRCEYSIALLSDLFSFSGEPQKGLKIIGNIHDNPELLAANE